MNKRKHIPLLINLFISLIETEDPLKTSNKKNTHVNLKKIKQPTESRSPEQHTTLAKIDL